MKKILILAVVLLGATACTPEETRFWAAFHADHPAEAEALLDELGLTGAATARAPAARVPTTTSAPTDPAPMEEPVPETPPVVRAGNRGADAPALSASTSCPSAITITNDDVVEHRVSGAYSAHQTPLVSAVDGQFPAVAPGASTTIDLTPARGQDNVQIFVDGGSYWVVDGVAC